MPVYSIVVVASVSPAPLPFAGTYQYRLGGETVTRDLSAEGSFTATFQADGLRYVRVVATSAAGMYSLRIHRNGELVFDSAAQPAAVPLTYSAEPSVTD